MSPLFRLTIPQDPMRTIVGVTVTSVTNTDPSEDDRPPGVPTASVVGQAVTDSNGRTVAMTFEFPLVGDGWSLDVEYSLVHEPSDEALAIWQEQSRIRPRPANDLRDEERYEILGRFVASAFGELSESGLPNPAEMELFHRYFDVSALFYWVHPSWWVPRHSIDRGEYEITDESEPAPFGRSLGWLIQLDGDRRRNELLNSPWIRACLPLRPGLEREALAWLAQHVEGTNGYSMESGSALGELVAAVETQRSQERLGSPGPDFVTLDGQIPPGREDSATAYPVVDEFNASVPTDGFIYELLTSS